MKTLKKPLSLFMALLMCLGVFAGTGVTAFAAGETMTTYPLSQWQDAVRYLTGSERHFESAAEIKAFILKELEVQQNGKTHGR